MGTPIFRKNRKPPVPFHALDNSLAAAMHREIRALHRLLLDAADSLGISPEETERTIVYRLKAEALAEGEDHDQD